MGLYTVATASLLLLATSFCHGGIYHYKLDADSDIKIIGGTDAQPHEFPFLINIQTRKEHWCSAVIIAPRFLITAVPCIYFATGGTHRFEAGRHNLSADETEFQQQPTMYNYYEHPFYSRDSFANDIVVVEMYVPYKYSHYIQPVQMADPKFPGESFAGPAVVMGWGRTTEGGEEGLYSPILRKANVEIFNDTMCKELIGSLYDDSMLCAGQLEGGADFCQGDNGGPLIQYNKDSTPIVVGLASWGYGCGRPGRPGVYNRISHFREWILAQL